MVSGSAVWAVHKLRDPNLGWGGGESGRRLEMGGQQRNKHKFLYISCEGAHPLSIMCTLYVIIMHQFVILNSQD